MTTDADTRPPLEGSTEQRTLPLWLSVVVGAAAAVVGLLPWLITGLRLPLQNLWATEPGPEGMPIALLPFSQYAIILIIALFVTGAGIAGVAARSMRRRMPRSGVAGTYVGLAAVHLLALVQSAVVVRGGLREGSDSDLYFAAIVTVAILSILSATAAYFLIAAAPRAGAVIGLGIVALAFGPWLSGLLVPYGSIPSDPMVTVVGYTRWVPAVLVGAAIAWGGVGTVGRVLAALFDLALVWFVPALTTGLSYAAGSRVLAHDPAGMIDAGARVFVMALTAPEIAVPPVVVAIVVAAIGLVARAVVGRRRERPAELR